MSVGAAGHWRQRGLGTCEQRPEEGRRVGTGGVGSAQRPRWEDKLWSARHLHKVRMVN